ncbi:hypothetical protein [Nocardia sp. 348MFTsu5.1]|uniref:hypothetical protein n=1 Tax=Nocardia sp. 348MFTsu5.1 TaxID=1172185 RepID=UPI00036D6EA0|nr:hypothetical protein [Nocardia sp. 348MFTsu5.1]
MATLSNAPTLLSRTEQPGGDQPIADPVWQPVKHRLITMRKAVRQLDELGPVEAHLLESNPAIGLVCERVLWLLADQAFAVNTRVGARALGEMPQTPTAAFDAVVKVGMIDADLRAVLSPPEAPHNVLVQLYMDTEPEKVAAVVLAARSGYTAYIEEVGHWITEHAGA